MLLFVIVIVVGCHCTTHDGNDVVVCYCHCVLAVVISVLFTVGWPNPGGRGYDCCMLLLVDVLLLVVILCCWLLFCCCVGCCFVGYCYDNDQKGALVVVLLLSQWLFVVVPMLIQW